MNLDQGENWILIQYLLEIEIPYEGSYGEEFWMNIIQIWKTFWNEYASQKIIV